MTHYVQYNFAGYHSCSADKAIRYQVSANERTNSSPLLFPYAPRCCSFTCSSICLEVLQLCYHNQVCNRFKMHLCCCCCCCCDFRYLFPPDGGWLVSGQLCHLATQAYATLASSSSSSSGGAAAVATLEIEHASSSSVAVLLGGALQNLPNLKTLNLNWCHIGRWLYAAKIISAFACITA